MASLLVIVAIGTTAGRGITTMARVKGTATAQVMVLRTNIGPQPVTRRITADNQPRRYRRAILAELPCGPGEGKGVSIPNPDRRVRIDIGQIERLRPSRCGDTVTVGR